jgi:hypothetical protein
MYLIPEIIDSIHSIRNTETIKRPYLSIIHNIAKLKYNILLIDFRTERNN